MLDCCLKLSHTAKLATLVVMSEKKLYHIRLRFSYLLAMFGSVWCFNIIFKCCTGLVSKILVCQIKVHDLAVFNIVKAIIGK